MKYTTVFVGMDVHKESFTLACYACSECPELETCMMGFFSDPYGCFAGASSMFRRDHGKESYLRALNSADPEEQKFLNDVKTDPADQAAGAEAIRRILKILESRI